MMYSVKITRDSGISYLSHRDRTAWSKRTALKFAREFVAAHGGVATVEQAAQLSNGQYY